MSYIFYEKIFRYAKPFRSDLRSDYILYFFVNNLADGEAMRTSHFIATPAPVMLFNGLGKPERTIDSGNYPLRSQYVHILDLSAKLMLSILKLSSGELP